MNAPVAPVLGGGLWGANYYDYNLVVESLDLWATQQQQIINGFSQNANNWDSRGKGGLY
jgi:hypothetical protein